MYCDRRNAIDNCPAWLVNCTIELEGIELEFILPNTIAKAFNAMRADEVAGLLPTIFQHEIMKGVPHEKVEKLNEYTELLTLSSERIIIRNVRRYVN